MRLKEDITLTHKSIDNLQVEIQRVKMLRRYLEGSTPHNFSHIPIKTSMNEKDKK